MSDDTISKHRALSQKSGSVKNKKALNAMTRARTVMTVRQPFFGCLSLQLELVEVDDEKFVNTMAVDGKHLFYHPPWVLGLKEEEAIGVIAHEVMHCAYKHMTRRGHRHHIIYNMAGDFVINDDLKKAGFTLPGPAITMATKPGIKGHLHDPKFEGMSTEEVYERIMQDVKVCKVYMVSSDKDIGGCGAVMDAGGKGDKKGNKDETGGSTAKNIENDWDANVRMAVAVAKKSNAGTVPGHLKRLVEDLDKPIINWREQLRDFISNSMTKDYSWARINRRSVSYGILLPGLISDAMQKLIVMFDCSGSIGEDLMKRYGSEAGGALDDGVCDQMIIVYTDTKVQKVDEFNRGELVKIATPGGGGTDFKEAMQWVVDNHPDANAIVFLTDMMTNSFGEDPDIPVLWGATLPHSQLKGINVPFGRVIEVPTHE